MNEQEKTTEISLSFLWAVLRHRWLPLLLALVVGAGAMLGFTKLFVSPVYSSGAEFAIEIKEDSHRSRKHICQNIPLNIPESCFTVISKDIGNASPCPFLYDRVEVHKRTAEQL